ncbi:hypothetical protein DPEC_G00067170 [Dallia pectoralis]|uniref:Uncharacterized protein n=1 Tax=Dallia pectoralis TaxID=75939 RepID=A0ACC2H8I3_DALPE|nr:hypothetical protein DPEC_G00067170 [Dallia pectoralis]
MNYSGLVVAWFSSLPVNVVQMISHSFGKLEMISFWLLCWRLLRATAGVKRIKGNELSKGCRIGAVKSPQGNNQPLHSEVTSMETSQLQEVSNLTDYKVDSWESEDLRCVHANSERQQDRKPSAQNPGIKENLNTSVDEPEVTETRDLCIEEEVSSDIWSGSCHMLDRDDLSECLQVEMAVVSSDSDADDQWRSTFSSTVNEGDWCDINAEVALETDGVIAEAEIGDTTGEGSQMQEQLVCPTHSMIQDQDVSSEQFRGRAKIPEDMKEVNQGDILKVRCSKTESAEPEKKVPQDYCVIQEMKSKNISTEHVDFQGARKQWLQMEEQTKGQIKALLPSVNQQRVCHRGHSTMYTPVRNINQPRRDPETKGLFLKHTQFSTCSEDSGLEDLSLREDSENLVKREIRQTIEREAKFKRERGIFQEGEAGESTGHPRVRPTALHTSNDGRGFCQVLDDKQKMFNSSGSGDQSRPLIHAKSPSFSISTSPTQRGATYHEITAQNVIILESDSYPSSPRHLTRGSLLSPGHSPYGDWPSETSANVIILETSNLIIRSASEFCLSSTCCQETQESTFLNNPFFKLRSRSSMSLVDQEIKMVKQREEEWRRQRSQMKTRETYDTVLVSPNLLEKLIYDRAEVPLKCVSSPSSPSRTRKLDRSALSCEHTFPESPSPGPR